MNRIVAVVVAVLPVGAGALWWGWLVVSAPLYTTGELAERADLNPTESTWEVADGVTLAGSSEGSGPHVVFVHGGPGVPPLSLASGLSSLASDFTVTTWDQRGSGRSSNPWPGPSGEGNFADVAALEKALGIGQQLADIERVRRQLGAEKLLLVGHSYGALLASLYAAEMPDRVEKLVLIAPADLLVFPSPRGGLFEMLDERLPAEERAGYQEWKGRYLDLWGVTARPTEELEALDAELLPYWERVMGPTPAAAQSGRPGVWHARAQFFSLGMSHDWSDFLGDITAPTLILHGERDLQPVSVSEEYQAAISGSLPVETLQGAGHFPHYTQGSRVEDRLRRFFQD